MVDHIPTNVKPTIEYVQLFGQQKNSTLKGHNKT